MKTVETAQGAILRLANDAAAVLVAEGAAAYVPKSRWKALRPDHQALPGPAIMSRGDSQAPDTRSNCP